MWVLELFMSMCSRKPIFDSWLAKRIWSLSNRSNIMTALRNGETFIQPFRKHNQLINRAKPSRRAEVLLLFLIQLKSSRDDAHCLPLVTESLSLHTDNRFIKCRAETRASGVTFSAEKVRRKSLQHPAPTRRLCPPATCSTLTCSSARSVILVHRFPHCGAPVKRRIH